MIFRAVFDSVYIKDEAFIEFPSIHIYNIH